MTRHTLGLEALPPPLPRPTPGSAALGRAEPGEIDGVGEPVEVAWSDGRSPQFEFERQRRRDHDIARCRLPRSSGGEVDDGAEDVTIAQHHLPRGEAHTTGGKPLVPSEHARDGKRDGAPVAGRPR